MPKKHRKLPFLRFMAILFIISAPFYVCLNCVAAEQTDEDVDLFALGLEELMNVEVMSTTRTKGRDLLTSPAAIYVITSEEME